MSEELKALCSLLSVFILTMVILLIGSLYSINKEANCKEIALNNKYEYKEIELICK